VSVFDSDQNVKNYESWFEKHPHVFQSEVAAIKEILPDGTGFEVGIGTGLFAERLGIHMGNDPSEEMLKFARKRGRLVHHCRGDSLPFNDGYFDYTLMVTTICFLDDPIKVLRECLRVTTHNGAIVIAFVDSESYVGKSYRNHASRNLFYRDATFYSVAQIEKLLVNAGFVVDKTRQTLFGALTDVKDIQPSKEGSGEGSFVIMRGMKH
jgi:SAM-dependent methyltransferase